MMQRGIDVGTALDGRYRLAERLTAAVDGDTFVAEDQSGQRYRVLVLEPENAPRFERDVAAAARLTSPHAVPILDHGVDGETGAPFLVMPEIEGETLRELIDRLGPVPTQAVLRIGIHLARALDEAHSKGVLHGRLRPANVLLERKADDTALARLVSFGMAWSSELAWASTATGAGATGLPRSAAAPVHIDTRSDVRAMATVLYVALAGRAPWDDPSAVERWELGQGDEPPWLQELAPWVDGAVARVVHGAMLRDAEQRCPSAYSLLGALVACLRGEDTLRWDMLEASREELRAPVASRAEPPASWQELAEGPSVGDLTDSLLGVTLDGRFELVRRVGAGGMGAVYEARDPDGNTRAIKVIKLELLAQGGDTLRRFVREARAAQAIDSDHVVRVIEAGSDLTRGLPFIVMEMLRGGDLASFVQANGPMDPTAAAWVFWRACQGLGRAHALGMVHRDVKPANIFLHESDNGTIIPKLCDFGVAKVDASLREHSATALTQTGGILGSPLYMAPEHAENAKHADARSDVWSLGISLYETLTGARPWADCSTIGELLLALYTKEVTPLQDRAPWVSPGLTALVHRALQREPTRRFADANEMALALAPFAKPFAAAGPTALQCVSPELRSRPAPRLDVAAVSGAAPVTTAPGRQSGRPLSTGLWAMGATVLLAAAGLAFYATRAVAPPAPDSAALPPPAVPSASRAAASVRIVPESASVSVDGMPAAVNAGTLTLVRGPGETAVVVVESAGVRQAASVVITADGRAVPDTIEVAPPTTSASASASPTVAVAGIAPPSTRTVPTKGAEATTQTAAPPPAASPTVPKFNKSW